MAVYVLEIVNEKDDLVAIVMCRNLQIVQGIFSLIIKTSRSWI